MVITEKYNDRLNRTYSSLGMYIEREGVYYSEAIDIASFGYEYAETDIPADLHP